MGSPPTEPPDRLPFSPAVGCLLSLLAGILCAGVFSLALWFSQQGEIAYAPDPLRGVRLWLVRGAGFSGLGVSTTRPLEGGSQGYACALTTVRFLICSGPPADDAVYCECFTHSESGWSPAGACGD
jgi:hypothetical protein